MAKYQTPAGTDINGVGIQPDIPLSKDIPTGVEGFCRVAEMTDAPKLFL